MQGFTFIEIAVALFVLSLVLVSSFWSHEQAVRIVKKADHDYRYLLEQDACEAVSHPCPWSKSPPL